MSDKCYIPAFCYVIFIIRIRLIWNKDETLEKRNNNFLYFSKLR